MLWSLESLQWVLLMKFDVADEVIQDDMTFAKARQLRAIYAAMDEGKFKPQDQ